jgi:hypothetical protein
VQPRRISNFRSICIDHHKIGVYPDQHAAALRMASGPDEQANVVGNCQQGVDPTTPLVAMA